MRFLYAGLPLGALALARAGIRPAVVLLGHPRAPGSRRVRRILGRQGSLLLGRPELTDPAVQELLGSAAPGALLTFFWPRRIPPGLLDLVGGRAFGVHPSLLPRWRGPDPYFWAIRSGDRETGVTLHRLTAHYDRGPVVAQRRIAVSEAQDAWSLARTLDRPALELLVQAAARIRRGESLDEVPQDEASATNAPLPSEADLAIDWRRMRAEEVVQLVRAAAPEPGATARLRDQLVEVIRARVARELPPRALGPAEAWRTSEGWAVRAADRGVLLVRVRLLDGTATDPGALLGR